MIVLSTRPPNAPTGRFISPSGNDTTGDGSLGNPWKTIGKFATVAQAGDTLYCRGGTYTNTSRIILQDGHPSGTAVYPITVRNYPNETPVFAGPGSGSYAQFLMVTDGVSHWTFDGLTLQGFKTGSSGVVFVGRNVGLMVPTHHIIVRNCTITTVYEGTGPFNHCVYLSAYAEDCTVEYNRLIGASVSGSDGCALTIGDHEPSPQRSLIQRNIMTGFGDAGAIWYNGGLNTGEILHNTFRSNRRNISLRYYVTVTVRDNAGEHGSVGYMPDIYNANDSGQGVATIDHNFWGQTFDANDYLVAGQTGRGAASDGTDAGALDW